MKKDPTPSSEFGDIRITAKQMGKLVGISDDRVMKLCDMGLVEYERNGNRGHYRILLSHAANVKAAHEKEQSRANNTPLASRLYKRLKEQDEKIAALEDMFMKSIQGMALYVDTTNEKIEEMEAVLDGLTAPSSTLDEVPVGT